MSVILEGGYAYTPKTGKQLALFEDAQQASLSYTSKFTAGNHQTWLLADYVAYNNGAAYLLDYRRDHVYGFYKFHNGGFDSTIAGSSSWRYYNKDVTAHATPAIVCVEYVKLSEYMTANPSIASLYKIGPLPIPPTDTDKYITGRTNDLIIPEFLADAVIPTKITFYDNSDDGHYSASNPRQTLNGHDLCVVYSHKGVTQYRNGNLVKRYDSSGDSAVSFVSQFRTPILANKGILYYPKQAGDLSTGQPIYAPAMWVNSDSTGDPIVALDSDNYQYSVFSLWKNLKTLQRAIDEWNIPYTHNPDYAATYNTADIPDYNPSGQPTNPTNDPDGDGDNTQDPMELVTPTMSPIGTMAHQYAVSATELRALSNYLWGTTFVADIRRLWEDPGELIISCVYYPLDLEQHDSTHLGEAGEYLIGNVTTPAGTTGRAIDVQYNKRIGSYTFAVNRYYGNYLDYDPYTKIDIYLPYIGYKTLSANDCMGRTLTINYYIDVSQGRCLAQVYAGDRLIGSYAGECGYNIPLSSTNAVQAATGTAVTAISGAMAVATGIVDIVATKGAGVPQAAADAAATGAKTAAGSTVALGALKIASGAVQSTAGVIQAAQLKVDRGGSIPTDLGAYDPQDIYVTITRPVTALPSNLNNVIGTPASYGGKVSEFSGYLECSEIKGSTTATAAENTLINNYLKGGIYI